MARKKGFLNKGQEFGKDSNLAGLGEAIDAASFPTSTTAEDDVWGRLSQVDGYRKAVEASDGVIRYRDFVMTMTGLEYHSDEPLQLEDWEEIGKWLNQLRDSTQWMIGDWVNMGFPYADEWMSEAKKLELQTLNGDVPEGKYKWIAGLVDLSYSTLRNIAYVASAVPVSRRRDTLTFSHHAEVAHLDEGDQNEFLNMAEPENNDGKRLPVRKLRDLIQTKYPPQLSAGKSAPKPKYERKDAKETLLMVGLEFIRKPPKKNAANRKTARQIAELYQQLALQLETYANDD